MATRIHIVLDEAEKARIEVAADGAGLSVSEWLRRAAREKMEALERVGLSTAEELDAFFEACDAREEGREPDWEEHRRVIEGSITAGSPEP